MQAAGSYRLQIARRRLAALLVLAATACLPATVVVGLVSDGSLAPDAAYAVALAGGAVAVLIAAAICIRVKGPAVRGTKPHADASATTKPSWAERANPREVDAARWAMYDDLTTWLGERDWKDKKVAEFGGTNDLLRAFLPDAEYELLAYPEHDAHDLHGVADDQFDLVILDQVLEHLAEPERALREVHRVVKPGGTAIVATPFLVPVHTGPGWDDFYRWTPQGLELALRRCGFDAGVRSWGNLQAAGVILESLNITAGEAMQRGVSLSHSDGLFPITVWAIATASAETE